MTTDKDEIFSLKSEFYIRMICMYSFRRYHCMEKEIILGSVWLGLDKVVPDNDHCGAVVLVSPVEFITYRLQQKFPTL